MSPEPRTRRRTLRHSTAATLLTLAVVAAPVAVTASSTGATGAEPGQLAVGGLVLGGDPAGGDEHGIAARAHQRAHLVDPPREVDRGRARVPHAVDRRLHLRVAPVLAGTLVHGEHDPQRAGDTEGGGTAHGQLGDRDDELVGGQDLPVCGAAG